MRLSFRSPDCWSSQSFQPWMACNQTCMFKQKLMNREPINRICRFVGDLRERHLENWREFLTDLMRCCMLWLFKTYAFLSAGMYASQIWSTQFLKHDNGFSNPLQVAHMAFLKRILGIYSCKLLCASRMRAGTLAILLVQVSCQILEHTGWLFKQQYFTRCYESRYFLGNSGASNCWTRQMKDAFGDLQNGPVYRSDLLNAGSWIFLICT